MKFRGLLVAVGLLAVLGGLLYWSDRTTTKDTEKKPAEAGPKILSIPADQIREVEIRKTDGGSTVLRKGEDGKWAIAAPKPLRADQDTVTSMVSALSALNGEKLVEEKAADVAAYGLAKPALSVKVTRKDGKVQDLLVGDETPTGSGSYARLKGDPRVFTIAGYTKSNFDKTSDDLRDKRLLTFDPDKVARVTLTARGQEIEFGKNSKSEWQILKPRPMRADGSQVETLVQRLRDARIEGASDVDAKMAAGAFAGAARVAAAGITDASGTQQLEVRRDSSKNYYAKSSVLDSPYKVGSELGDGLDKAVDDFRNKKLFDFGWTDPTSVEVQNLPGAAAAYAKSGDKWMSGSRQLDSGSVQALIDKLRDLTAAKVTDSGGGGTPVFEAKVTSQAGSRVEKVTVTKAGNTFFAKRENEPGIYELDGQVVDALQKAAAGVKDYQPPKKT